MGATITAEAAAAIIPAVAVADATITAEPVAVATLVAAITVIRVQETPLICSA